MIKKIVFSMLVVSNIGACCVSNYGPENESGRLYPEDIDVFPGYIRASCRNNSREENRCILNPDDEIRRIIIQSKQSPKTPSQAG